jgi:hypothetical protein
MNLSPDKIIKNRRIIWTFTVQANLYYAQTLNLKASISNSNVILQIQGTIIKASHNNMTLTRRRSTQIASSLVTINLWIRQLPKWIIRRLIKMIAPGMRKTLYSSEMKTRNKELLKSSRFNSHQLLYNQIFRILFWSLKT